MSLFGWSYPPGAANHPDAPYNQDDDWGEDLDELIKALEGDDTGKWEWEKIACCLTGKDADLDPWGQQGIELVSCNEETVNCKAHIYATMAGTDVCLNLEPEIEEDDARMEVAHEAFMEQAQEVVCGCSVPGEWDGDCWCLSTEVEYAVEWVMDGTDPDYAATAKNIVSAAHAALSEPEKEIVGANETLNMLAGWTDGPDGNKCPAGKPSPYAAWRTES